MENWCWNDMFELLENKTTATRVFLNFKIMYSLLPSYLLILFNLLNYGRLKTFNKMNLNNKQKSIHTGVGWRDGEKRHTTVIE